MEGAGEVAGDGLSLMCPFNWFIPLSGPCYCGDGGL